MQRAVIALRAKDVEFEVSYVNLRDKPDWFLEISPHGKVPLLKVDDSVLFESNAIAEFLDETVAPRLHPEDPVKRARHRAWTDFVPEFSRHLGTITYAKNKEELAKAMKSSARAMSRVEEALLVERDNDGPFFNGTELSLVDAAYAPFLMRYTISDQYVQSGFLQKFPNIARWAEALVQSDVIKQSVSAEFEDLFHQALIARKVMGVENTVIAL